MGAFGGQRRNLSLGSWTPSWEWIGLGKKDIPAGDVVAAKADETAAAAQQAAQAAPDAVQATQAVSDAVSAATDSVAATATDLATSIVPPSAEAAAALLSNAEFSGFPHSVWSLAGLAERYLDLIHASTGLPWWASIVIGTLIFRLAAGYVIMPGVQRGAAKMANATPIIRPLAERAAQAKKQGNKDEMMRASQDMAAKYKELGISPVSTVLPMLIQAPLFIGMFMGLRAMSEMPFPGFQDGGLWWFTDLSTADPTMVLPVVAIGLQLVINEVRRRSKANESVVGS